MEPHMLAKPPASAAVSSCVHVLFEAQVARTPDAVAVTFEGASLTYQQLDARANALAHHLVARGVRPEDRVALAVERTPEWIVGLLGILKAGGAYVPLDLAYPMARLGLMLESARPRVVLTRRPGLERLPPVEGATLCLEDLEEVLARGQARGPAVEVKMT
jgi:non-ribosomal peptide synthetase component F